ncbi:MAG: transposase [Syntrophomonadaceae bacterium]|nr:transposase [Syntrophomonadaceae bacterium]
MKQYAFETAKKTYPRSADTYYYIFCAVLYRLLESCRWKSLPHGFPNWKICCCHYNAWRTAKDGEASVLDRILRKMVEPERLINGRGRQTAMITVDSKSVKNTDTAEEKGSDAGKNSGRSI